MISIRKYIEEYRNSLKHPEAEEVIDLLFFRPIAFFLVKLIYRLPVTPNQISLLSLAAGVFSAYFLSFGQSDYYRTVAILLLGANLLDCMDGQLARLQGSGTFLGRVVDGVADYIAGIAIFVAMGLGFESIYVSIWLLVAVAGISTVLQAMAFDHYQGEFIKVRSGKGNITADEVNAYNDNESKVNGSGGGGRRTILSGIYLFYLKMQDMSRNIFPRSVFHPERPAGRSRTTIRLWSFMGLSTNRSILIFFCFLGIPGYFLYAVIIACNLWFGICLFIQHLASNQRHRNKESI